MTEINEQLDIEKFNPTVAEIQRVVDEGKKLVVTDFSDKSQVKLVRDHRLQLKEIRVTITKQGKAFRQKALDFQKAVIGKEKELIALVEPEEERLAAIEDQATAFEEREKRRELLPKRLERLASLKDGVEISEEEILNMESTAFEGYCNKRLADKNEKDRVANEAKERELKEVEAKAAREKEIKEAEDRARADERKRAEEAEANLKVERERAEKESKERLEGQEILFREAKERVLREEKESKERVERTEREAKERADKIEREAKEKVEHEERERKEKAEAEAKAEAERKEKLSKTAKWQEFILSHGYTEEKAGEFYIEIKGNTHSLYKKVGEITL